MKWSKLVSDCRTEETEKQTNLLLQLLSQPSTDLNLLLVSRILTANPGLSLRPAHSRLSKRLILVSKQPVSVTSGIFVRALLAALPSIATNHRQTLLDFSLALLDLSVDSPQDNHLRRLAVEVFSLLFHFSLDTRILFTLAKVSSGSLLSPKDLAVAIELKALNSFQKKDETLRVLLLLLVACFSRAAPGETISLVHFLPSLESSLRVTATRDTALECVANIVRVGGSSTLAIASRLEALLVSLLEESPPSNAFFHALFSIHSSLGVASLLHKHFQVIFNAFSASPDEACKAVGAQMLSLLLETSSAAIKVPVLISAQQSLCIQVAKEWSDESLLRLLNAFLGLNHDLVPSALQVARSVLWRGADSLEKRRGRVLCEALARPRTTNLAQRFVESRSHRIETAEEVIVLDQTVSTVEVEEEEEEPPVREELLEETNLTKDSDVIVLDDAPVIEDAKKKKKRKKRRASFVDENAAKEPRKSEVVVVEKSFSIVKKEQRQPPPSTLKKGEASVDEILAHLS